ncbi:WbqC family protein [Endozoicomonas sp. ALD040]|uniref:WbqC family protein n=1 Tax=unclassified Endozoicomonas TaxID=2644528 RepID=UPI003BB15F2D
MKKVAISQSNYIPWKGYFDLINSVDDFVLYDDMQYTRRDWRNRNKIYTAHGLKWLTVPVNVKGKYFQKINETTVSDLGWREQHWRIIKQEYSKAPYFKEYSNLFENLYLNGDETFLSKINYNFIILINKILDISTNIYWSSDFDLCDGKSERLLGICKDLNAKIYLSGPSAKGYLDSKIFENENIRVEWMDYFDYPTYQQIHAPFESGVSILDLIFNKGPDAKEFMKSF